MLELATFVIAKFMSPEDIGNNQRTLLLILPLLAAIALVYKATKLSKITPLNFIKETVLLFFSIAIFMIITALVLAGVGRFFTS